MWQKLHRGGGHPPSWGLREAPQSVCDATALCAQLYAPKGGRPAKHTKRGAEVMVVASDAPPTPNDNAPTSSPKPSKVAKVAPQPPPPRPLMWGLWPPLWRPT